MCASVGRAYFDGGRTTLLFRGWDPSAADEVETLPAGASGADYFLATKGGKWEGLHEFFAQHPKLLEKYDWIWLPDDDIDAPPGWLDAYISGAEAYPDYEVFGGPIRAVLEGGGPRACGRESAPIRRSSDRSRRRSSTTETCPSSLTIRGTRRPGKAGSRRSSPIRDPSATSAPLLACRSSTSAIRS